MDREAQIAAMNQWIVEAMDKYDGLTMVGALKLYQDRTYEAPPADRKCGEVIDDSEVVRYIGYDPEKAALDVGFTNGNLYRYYGVPATIHDTFREAWSKGLSWPEDKGNYLFEKVC